MKRSNIALGITSLVLAIAGVVVTKANSYFITGHYIITTNQSSQQVCFTVADTNCGVAGTGCTVLTNTSGFVHAQVYASKKNGACFTTLRKP